MRRFAWLLAAMLLLTGCTGKGSEPAAEGSPAATTGPPMADCSAIAAAPLTDAEPAGEVLPNITLPCLVAGGHVRLTDLRVPIIINLWASWCPPCRKELPAFQRYANRTAGRVQVLGVVTKDDRDAAKSLAADLAVTLPALYDREQLLLKELVAQRLSTMALPVTVFVGANGEVNVYNNVALDDEKLSELAVRYLGPVAR